MNLSDNHLDDEGLSVLLRAISKHKSIEILDISQNVIGQEAAEALAEFLGRQDCRLQCLRMSNANIDDGECANFVEVLMSTSENVRMFVIDAPLPEPPLRQLPPPDNPPITMDCVPLV